MVGILFFIISSVYIYFIVNVGKTYEKHAVENIVAIKKESLKNMVDHVILEIELVESQQKQYHKEWIHHAEKTMGEYYKLSPDHYIDLFIKFYELNSKQDLVSILIRDTSSDTILYENGLDLSDGLDKKKYSAYFQKTYDQYEVFCGITTESIDERVKATIATRIRNKEFAQNNYIWVNEIKDYKGGKDYAIRLIHPNLKETEGQFLSTYTQDALGNYPYAQELEGIKEDGEIFFNYYFKKKDSHLVSEKITYAKLYEKYNWVVAMGTHIDDIEAYIDISTRDKNQIVEKMIKHTIILMLVIFALYWACMFQIERWYYGKYNKRLKEVYVDPLTKTQNRRSGTTHLELAFKEFKKTGKTPSIIMIDIDDFKQVNDTYGHFEGDLVLKNVVKVIQNNIRQTDAIYRWGGEEFLLICNGLKDENVINFSNKIISLVAKKEYNYNGEKYHATISMGIDQFDQADKSYEASVKRADMAMYRAKAKGKNRACTGEMCGINPLNND